MATQTSLDRVQQLYVAYYGRPADQEGQLYWAERMDAEGEGAIINAFGNSPEYQDRFGEMTLAEAVNNLYLQSFGRNADPDGLTYYVGVLQSGEKSLAEIATTIINAAGGIDKLTFDAKVKAAAAYTAEFGAAADYDLEAAIDAVTNAPVGIDASALTEALGTLKAAQDAVESFLEGARGNEALQENRDIDGESTVAEVRTAIGVEYTEATSTMATATGVGNFADRSASVQDSLASDALAQAEKAVSDFQAEINKISGLNLAVRNYNSAVAAQADASDALDDAEDESLAAIAAFETRNNGVAEIFVDTNGDVFDGTDNTGVLVMQLENGVYVIEDAYAETTGIAALRTALQAEYDAEVALSNANVAVTTTANTLATFDAAVAAGEFGAITTGVGVAVELADRQETLTDLKEAIARFENARDLRDDLADFDESAQDALEAITDSVEDGGLGVNLITNFSAATADDDVYLYSAQEFDPAAITGFGASGEDRIFFGDEYTLVQLEGAWSASASTGDASALEIFWVQSGANLVLYVEDKAFAGNGTTEGDITKIELAGVSANDIDFSGGYLTAGEPA
jgi:hypothetical protein